MCRIGTILLVVALIIAAAHVRHRLMLHRAIPAPVVVEDDSPDVAAVLRTLSGHETVADEKSWAVRFAQFINAHPGTQWVVGRSRTPCLSEAEASEAARQDGAAKVYPFLLQNIGTRRVDAGWLRERLMQDVRAGRLDADRFAESFNRPYGQVWTESVLLDVSPARLDPLLARYRDELNVRHIQFRRHLAAAAVISIGTALAYLLLNSITKGYFTMRLRLAAMLIVAAAVVILL